MIKHIAGVLHPAAKGRGGVKVPHNKNTENCKIIRMHPLSTLKHGCCTAPGGTIYIEKCENYAPKGVKYDDLVYSFSN